MTRREELAREAARLFAEKGYHGTSIGALADAIGVQKGSLYAHIEGKQDLLHETMRQGAEAFHGALDEIPEELPATEKIRLALRGPLFPQNAVPSLPAEFRVSNQRAIVHLPISAHGPAVAPHSG